MQGFLWTPWNATSRTTAQDALWQHILDRNTSSSPLMTPCAHQVMNRIPGNVMPPWAGCWGPLHSCSMSRAIYLPAERNRQPARPTPQTEAPNHTQARRPLVPCYICPQYGIISTLKIPAVSCGFLRTCITQVQSTFATIPRHFHDGSQHSSVALGMLSVTHIMPILVLHTCMDANMQFTFK